MRPGDNRIGPEGGRCLGAALMHNSALLQLHLGGNRLGDVGVIPMGTAARWVSHGI
jgi:hypothetical protein